MRNVTEHKDKDGQLVFRINRTTKSGTYFPVNANERQKQYLHGDISLKGFDRLPAGFYKEGYGMTRAGELILQQIFTRKNKKIKLTVSSNLPSRLNLQGQFISLTLNANSLSSVGNKIRAIRQQRNAEMALEVQKFLGSEFQHFRSLRGAVASYVPGTLAHALSFEKITSNLSAEDRSVLEEFIPDYLHNIPGTLKSKKKLQVVFDALDAGKTLYLGKIIKEFKSKLAKNVRNENIWQRFLSDYVLLLQYNYGEVLEKQNVSLKIKFPDFMLIDSYGYLDIHEIKTPATQLMRFDASRGNYFWDTEMSKAIAQVENYMHQCQRHADILMTDIRKEKGLDINIVRPRGFIIAGRRLQLTSQKMKDDFRIMSSSLKNVDIILYDDLLESLEAFVKRADKTNDLKNRSKKGTS